MHLDSDWISAGGYVVIDVTDEQGDLIHSLDKRDTCTTLERTEKIMVTDGSAAASRYGVRKRGSGQPEEEASSASEFKKSTWMDINGYLMHK